MHTIDLNDTTQESIFALMYGASGTGKTHFAGTLGELGNTLVIDIDQGSKTIKYAPDLEQARKNITVASFDDFKDLDQAYKLVYANDPSKWNSFFKRDVATKPFDWIAWDTWSEIQWFMHTKLRKDIDRAGSGKLDFRQNIRIQDWGSLTDLNKLAIQALRGCSVNQIFTMQEKLMKDELTGAIYGGPAIHGKMVQEMPVYFDVVAHSYSTISGKFATTTKSKGRWPAKTRLGLGGEVINPRASDLF